MNPQPIFLIGGSLVSTLGIFGCPKSDADQFIEIYRGCMVLMKSVAQAFMGQLALNKGKPTNQPTNLHHRPVCIYICKTGSLRCRAAIDTAL